MHSAALGECIRCESGRGGEWSGGAQARKEGVDGEASPAPNGGKDGSTLPSTPKGIDQTTTSERSG